MKVRLVVALAAAATAALVAVGSAGAAQDSTCPGGILTAGVYQNVTVNGSCVTSGGSVFIKGNLTVNGSSSFSNQGGFVGIAGNVAVFPKGVLFLEDAEIGHSVSADRALAIVLSATEIGFAGGNGVLIQGAGSTTQVGACARRDVPIFETPIAIVASSEIAGNVTIDGYVGCEAGIGSNEIGGSVTFTNNRTDTNGGGNLVSGNLIFHNLFCKMNQPPPIGSLNSVGGTVTGACNFLV